MFVIQRTQKRDSKAMNLKLDEIIRAVTGADNELIGIEKVPMKNETAVAAAQANPTRGARWEK